jgi:hypothetical protein
LILRICENGHERLEPASAERVARLLAPDAPILEGTEITLAEAERWLTALAVGPSGSSAELLMSGADGETATVSGTAARAEALRLFREFMAARGSLR